MICTPNTPNTGKKEFLEKIHVQDRKRGLVSKKL
jgi:hypothetical protein